MFEASAACADGAPERPPDGFEEATDGGGGTTLELIPAPFLAPLGIPKLLLLGIDGEGAITFAFKEAPFDPARFPVTVGGGGTTSVGPKILPMIALSRELLPDCVGGGGTTAFAGSAALPLASRRMSAERSELGGGAMTEGDGMVSRALRDDSRSGDETGGGTTAGFVI
jgi:hypothetical protein